MHACMCVFNITGFHIQMVQHGEKTLSPATNAEVSLVVISIHGKVGLVICLQ